MSSQTWVLADSVHNLHEGEFCITANDLPGAEGSWKVTQQVLQCGLSAGVDLIEIDNGRMRLFVIPTRGMGIWQAKIADETLGWKSPVRGPVHPRCVPIFDPGGLGWLEGFDEFLVRCGLESNGAPEFDAQGRLLYPLHGRIANRPAHYVDVTVDSSARTITVRGIVEESRLHFQKLRLEASITTSFDSTSFTINDEVENFGGTSAEMQMLYHINVGEPLLASGDQIVAPVDSIKKRNGEEVLETDAWNVFGPAVAGDPEECYFMELLGDNTGQTQALLRNAGSTTGIVVKFNVNYLPYFIVWKNQVASEDGYVTGLEPATNFPNERTLETKHGRVIKLPPGKKWSAELVIDWLTNLDDVRMAEEAICELKNGSG